MTTTGTTTIYEHMFRSFGLRENPFHVSPDPRFLFLGRSYETAFAELMFGIEAHRGLLVMTGEAGTGKTTLMRHFLQWLKDRQFSSSYIFHAHLDPSDMFEFILRDFGVPVESSRKSDLLTTLHRWLHTRQTAGDSPVIVIDEAQALSLRTLNELILLLNLENPGGKLVQIVLAGQPELEEKLRRPESRALRQRIMVRCRLPLLSLEETVEYIASRLRGAGGSGEKIFSAETIQTVYSYARGIPRVVNLLCEQALIGAYADRSAIVTSGNVRRVAAEFDLVGEPFQAGNLEVKFTPKFPAKSLPVPQTSAVPEKPAATAVPASEETVLEKAIAAPAVPASEEIPALEQAMAAAAGAQTAPPIAPVFVSPGPIAEAERPLSQPEAEQQLEPELQPEPELLQPIVESAIFEEEKTAQDARDLLEQKAPQTVPVPDQPHPNLMVQSEDIATDQSRLETPKLETVAAEIRRESAPPAIAGETESHEEQLRLHIVSSSEKLQPPRNYIWRKHRSHRSHRSRSAFAAYWRDVTESFVRDWRAFFTSLAPQVSAFAGNVPQRADSFRRKVITPLRMWLRTPVNPTRRRSVDGAPPRTPIEKP